MNEKISIQNQLSELGVKNNIIELLLSIIPINDETYNYMLTEVEKGDLYCYLQRYSFEVFDYEIENKDSIIKILNHYIKISNPSQNCRLLIENIIDNINDKVIRNGLDLTFGDVDNQYLILLYYLNMAF